MLALALPLGAPTRRHLLAGPGAHLLEKNKKNQRPMQSMLCSVPPATPLSRGPRTGGLATRFALRGLRPCPGPRLCRAPRFAGLPRRPVRFAHEPALGAAPPPVGFAARRGPLARPLRASLVGFTARRVAPFGSAFFTVADREKTPEPGCSAKLAPCAALRSLPRPGLHPGAFEFRAFPAPNHAYRRGRGPPSREHSEFGARTQVAGLKSNRPHAPFGRAGTP